MGTPWAPPPLLTRAHQYPLPGPALREPRLPALVPAGGDGPHQPAGPDGRPLGHRAQPAGAGAGLRWGRGAAGSADAVSTHTRQPLQPAPPSPTGGPFFQASPVSVYLFPGERSGAHPPSPAAGAPTGSLGSRSGAKEAEKEEEGDGDTLDSDEFCILDAPGLGILVCGGQAGQGQEEGAQLGALLELPL